jgi:hypothetical protein
VLSGFRPVSSCHHDAVATLGTRRNPR